LFRGFVLGALFPFVVLSVMTVAAWVFG